MLPALLDFSLSLPCSCRCNNTRSLRNGHGSKSDTSVVGFEPYMLRVISTSAKKEKMASKTLTCQSVFTRSFQLWFGCSDASDSSEDTDIFSNAQRKHSVRNVPAHQRDQPFSTYSPHLHVGNENIYAWLRSLRNS